MAENKETVEPTVAELQAKVTGLENDKAALANEVAELKTTLNVKEGEIANLTQTKGDLAGELSQADSLLAGQKLTIDELTAELDSLKANPSSVPSFTYNKKTYEVHATSFQFRDSATTQPRTYTVAELLKDKALQKALVEKGMGFLVERQ